jgi:hypothetical protein
MRCGKVLSQDKEGESESLHSVHLFVCTGNSLLAATGPGVVKLTDYK